MNTPKIRKPDESWSSAFLREYATRVGVSMLEVLAWVALFVVANAGLRFYGL